MNMGYCRFQNTTIDIEDCIEHIEDTDLSREEFRARKRFIGLCMDVAENFADLLEEDYEDYIRQRD